jgi:hypothetical protein
MPVPPKKKKKGKLAFCIKKTKVKGAVVFWFCFLCSIGV